MITKTYEKILREYGFLYWKTVGKSMYPLIHENDDTVLIRNRTKERLKKYDVVLFRRPNKSGRGKYVLHRIMKVNNDGTYWIIGDNCFDGETVNDENILGVLEAMIHDKRKISVHDFSYYCFVHLWCAIRPLRFGILKCRAILLKIVCRALSIIKNRR